MARAFKDFFAAARQHAEYWAELAILDFTSALESRMERLNVSRAELAERVGASPAYISKVLNGTTNFTVKSMATLAHALGQRISIRVEDQDAADSYILASTTLDTLAAPARGQLMLLSAGESQEFEASNENEFTELVRQAA